jgi:plasmid maintenance system antidote protein VapI
MFNTEQFGEFMRANDLTQEGLADRLGVSRNCVHRILHGSRKPSSDFLGKLKQQFPGVDLDLFFSSSVADECHLEDGEES